MAKTSRRKSRVTVKEMKFRNDPMIRLYEKTQDWLQEKGRSFVISLAVVCGLVLLYTVGYYFFSYRESNAEAKFAEAYAKYSAPVLEGSTTTTPPVGPVYTDEKLKWQETADAFERLASDYSSYYGTTARYYAGVAYLHFDRGKGVELLQAVVAKNEQPTSDLARMALAENYAATGDMASAINNYESLLNSSAFPRQVVQLGLGRAYEKSGDTQKAIEAYFESAKADRNSAAGAEAEKRLSALAPARIKELPAPNAPAS